MDISGRSNVLIVDDNPMDLNLLKTILKDERINIIETNSAVEALNKIKGIDLALALVDIQMPGMNGIELVKRIRQDSERELVPIIFLTAYYSDQFHLLEGYGAGAVDYLIKPVIPFILLSKIRTFLELDRQKIFILESKKKLEESSDRLTAIYENIAGGIVLIDRNYIIKDVNEAACKITGFRKDELIGYLCDRICPKGSESKNCPIWEGHMNEFKGMDTLVKCEDGTEKPILKNAKLINYRGDTMILEIFQDVSDLKYTEAALLESEQNYRTIVEQSLQGIIVVKDSKIVFANNSFARMSGYTIDELEKLSCEQLSFLLGGDFFDQEKYRSNYYAGQESRNPLKEYKGHRKDGSGCWFQISTDRIRYQGEIMLQGFVIDITRRKLTEEALIESENMYRTLLDASPEGILIIDLAGHIIEVSGIALEIFGTENKQDLVGKHFLRFLNKESYKKVKSVIEKTISEGLEQDIEFILTKINGENFIGEVSTTLIQENNGMPRSFMAIIRDISQRKEIEKQMIHTERMAGLGEMATGIAHEINQPLNTISMSLENMLMKISQIPQDRDHYLIEKINKIFENIYRISKIIDHIRAFSRDHDDYIPTAFDINESIKNALSMISAQCSHRGIELITDLSNELPAISGNTYRFEQVIMNLLINAKDALEEKEKQGSFNKEIKLRSYLSGQTVNVEVNDNGIGIKKEDIGNVMLPFYSTKEVGKGTGMGLAISFGIIKEMKGTIDIQSEIFKGTLILIRLPLPIE